MPKLIAAQAEWQDFIVNIFVQSAYRRRAIADALASLGDRREAGTLEPEGATRDACGLILDYLRDVVDAQDIAELFARATGIRIAESQPKN